MITNNLFVRLQVPIISVRQSDRNAVIGQRCVRSAAAAFVHGHDGTTEGRPTLGMTHNREL